MSDKLKIVQTRICSQETGAKDLYFASIGYPDLKTIVSEEGHANLYDCHQPEIDESEFDRLVQAAEESKLIA
jgi:hypothetical protein